MPDYQKMYFMLFNEMSKAIDILQKAQCITEEMYISSSPPILLPQRREEEPPEE